MSRTFVKMRENVPSALHISDKELSVLVILTKLQTAGVSPPEGSFLRDEWTDTETGHR